MHKTFPNQFYKECQMTFTLFVDVTNAKELVQWVKSGAISVTLLKPHMVTGFFPVVVAANRAVTDWKREKLKTMNVHSEILYCLSPDKNIFQSFKHFGLGDNETSVLVVIINDKDDKVLDEVRKKVLGTEVPIDEWKSNSDVDLLKKIYKITDLELSTCSLEDAIVTRIASKGLVNLWKG